MPRVVLLVRVRVVQDGRKLLDAQSAKRFVAVHVVRHCENESIFEVQSVVSSVCVCVCVCVCAEGERARSSVHRNDGWMCFGEEDEMLLTTRKTKEYLYSFIP